MRETGIFTGTTNSPSHSLRQSLYRYAIRAGRNLPDKEFRYLRTVIVTAAVHRGFRSKLLPPFSGPSFAGCVASDGPTPIRTASNRVPAGERRLPKHTLRNQPTAMRHRASGALQPAVSDSY